MIRFDQTSRSRYWDLLLKWTICYWIRFQSIAQKQSPQSHLDVSWLCFSRWALVGIYLVKWNCGQHQRLAENMMRKNMRKEMIELNRREEICNIIANKLKVNSIANVSNKKLLNDELCFRFLPHRQNQITVSYYLVFLYLLSFKYYPFTLGGRKLKRVLRV